MNRRTLVALVLSLAIVGVANADYTFKPNIKVKDDFHYKLKGTLQIAGQEATLDGTLDRKIVEVKENGDYTVEETQSNTKVQFGGQEMNLPDNTSTTSYTAAGDIVEIKSDKVDPLEYRFANMSLFHLPDAAVAEGGTWTYEAKSNDKTGAVGFKATYKVVGEEKIGNRTTVKISMSIKESEGSEPASSECLLWLDTTDMMPVKTENNLTNAPIPGAPGPVSGKIGTTREG
ncbi:MAG: hypothetical protein JSS72_02510 [Armatimonadetes bacterium]|nr:hypothetical protein [Armatimonadota bacterium]